MSRTQALSSFIESAPPGELSDVTKAIKNILGDDSVQSELEPAFQKHNEEQFSLVKLPGSNDSVIVSPYNSLGDGRYYDSESQSSFAYDHASLATTASDVRSYVVETNHEDLLKGLLKSLRSHGTEHYPKYHIGVYPTNDDAEIALITVASKYSPNNYWNGRWRSSYLYTPASSTLTGTIAVDVHYYEDGNVRLLTHKKVDVKVGGSGSAADVVKAVALAEKAYQEDLNKAFGGLAEGAFKSLRRQLPITRQKIEWEKISGYRLGQDIGGGSRR